MGRFGARGVWRRVRVVMRSQTLNIRYEMRRMGRHTSLAEVPPLALGMEACRVLHWPVGYVQEGTFKPYLDHDACVCSSPHTIDRLN